MQSSANLFVDQKSTSLVDQKSTSLFDKIYTISKDAKNNPNTLEKLREILEVYESVDICGTNNMTPAGKLASELNREAVEVLMHLGANVDLVAKGAASAGDIDFAEYLRTTKKAKVNCIAEGAAFGGHLNYALSLIKFGAHIYDIACGAALGGHIAFVQRLLDEYESLNINLDNLISLHDLLVKQANRSAVKDSEDAAEIEKLAGIIASREIELEEKKYLASHIAIGAAQSGHSLSRKFAKSLLLDYNVDPTTIASAAASGGHKEDAETLRIQHKADVNIIAYQAASGGHIAYAEFLRTECGADVNIIARGAATGGHIAYAENLRTQYNADIDLIAEAAAFGRQTKYAEYLYTIGADVDRIAKGAAKGEHIHSKELGLCWLSSSANEQYRTAFANAITENNLASYKADELLPRADQIYTDMTLYRFNFDQAFAITQPEINLLYTLYLDMTNMDRAQETTLLLVVQYLVPISNKDAKGILSEYLKEDSSTSNLAPAAKDHKTATAPAQLQLQANDDKTATPPAHLINLNVIHAVYAYQAIRAKEHNKSYSSRFLPIARYSGVEKDIAATAFIAHLKDPRNKIRGNLIPVLKNGRLGKIYNPWKATQDNCKDKLHSSLPSSSSSSASSSASTANLGIFSSSQSSSSSSSTSTELTLFNKK